MQRILIIDDEKSLRELLAHVLKRAGYRVTAAENGEAGCQIFETDVFDLVISDISMPGIGGLEVLRKVRESSPDTPVILITAYGSKETAIEAVKLGAFDYFEKPFNVEEVRTRVHNALAQKRLAAENVFLRREIKGKFHLVGSSPKMRLIYDLIHRVADTASTLMISGESGTGKEQIARAVHYNSVRRDRQFVSINCGALPSELLESELFGHMRGSFTGATVNKRGLFEVADGGTIFLDEIGETSPVMQVKLLRVLQEKKIRRVGGTEEIEVDARVLTATNQDLEAMVREKRFREDLYYRIAVIPIRLPALRERREDIPELADHFLQKHREIIGKKKIARVAPEALELLLAYDWPGNIRELENVIERAVALEMGEEIGVEGLPFDVRTPMRRASPEADVTLDGGMDLEKHLEEQRVAYMREALRRTGSVQSHAAKLLGMTFRSFRYFAKKHDLGGDRGDAAEPEAVELGRGVEHRG